jgi:hypothetical protein
VLYVPEGFAGFAYWMACTPYPFARDREENPIVRVSCNGTDWHPVPNASDPLVKAPPDSRWHHADTDLVLVDGALHLFYISTNREAPETTFSWMTSTDGVNWSPPAIIYQAEWGVSPSAVAEASDVWKLWYVWRDALARDQTSVVYRRDGAHPCSLGEPIECKLIVPGHVVWHVDVIHCESVYEVLVAAFPVGTDPSRCRLFHAWSRDGWHFELTFEHPILAPSTFGWDNRMVYRSTFLKAKDGSYKIWYSGASWGMRCGIGLVEGPLQALRPADSTGHAQAVSPFRKLFEDAAGAAKYAAYRLLPDSAFLQVVAARRRLRRVLGLA